MKKLFDYDPVEVQKIMDLKKQQHQARGQLFNAQTGAPIPAIPAQPTIKDMVHCFHCGTQFDYLKGNCYEITKHYVDFSGGRGFKSTKFFHESCFEEVAGKNYIK